MYPIMSSKFIKPTTNLSESNNLSGNCERDKFLKIEQILGKTNSENIKNNNKNFHIQSEGVYSVEMIQKDSVSCDISSEELIRNSIRRKYRIKVSSTDGYLRSISFKSESIWIKSIQLAKDVHSNNAVIELKSNGYLRLRIIKDISENEEIIVWFSEDIAMLMNIPFLTPTNIRGNNCYTCHNCQSSFEYPNPLKIHLATSCDQQSLDFLWMRLHYTFLRTQHQQTPSQPILRTSPEPTKPMNPALLFPHNILMRSALFSYDRHSAFKPITPPPSVSISNNSHLFLHHQQRQHHHYQFSSISHSSPSHQIISSAPIASSSASSSPSEAAASAAVAALNAAAQIETIVSNMGASKQGHLCIYCGKLYSRKYGLKIHIRTHTGFKPLKCKFCLRPFGDPSNLNKHVRLHMQTGNLSYRCHLCHKTLARRRDLQRHIETKHCRDEVSIS